MAGRTSGRSCSAGFGAGAQRLNVQQLLTVSSGAWTIASNGPNGGNGGTIRSIRRPNDKPLDCAAAIFHLIHALGQYGRRAAAASMGSKFDNKAESSSAATAAISVR